MWIVRVALNRPYTFIVLALLILILSPVVILRTPTDIFPNIDIPVIAVSRQFTGLNPEEMEGRITTQYERVLASTVPILQLALSGLSEAELNDVGLNFLRTQLVTVPGASVPFPYGGKQRQIMVNLNQGLLQAKGLSPNDVLTVLGTQNLILPGGTVKMGQFEYDVDLNADVKNVQELNDLPIKTVGSSTIYLRDVATVSDGF